METGLSERKKVLYNLKDEAEELEERIDKLMTALFSDGSLGKVGKMQFVLMSKQLAGMQSYYSALQNRIVDLMAKEAAE